MTASGTKTYHGVFKARCTAVTGNNLTVAVPQVFGDTLIVTSSVVGTYPDAGTFGYISFEGGDPAYPVWLGTLASTKASTVGANYYGSFEYKSLTSVSGTSTGSAMPLDTTDFSVGVSISNTSHVLISNAGIYNIQWSGQFQNNSNSLEDINVWIRKNGVDIAGSNGRVSIPARKSSSDSGSYSHEIIGWNYFLQFNSNDYFQLMWSATNTTVSLVSYDASTSPAFPSTAALILTVSMV